MVSFPLRNGPTIILDDYAPTDVPAFILFKHPAYSDELYSNVLLRLYAWDANGGLHAGTAILACQIIACNAWDGYLTIERDGPRLEISHDGILTAPEYYFHVPTPAAVSVGERPGPYKYPICPSFQHWEFPHERLPTKWRKSRTSGPRQPIKAPSVSSVSDAVIWRDGGCILSKSRDYIDRAHLCPRSEFEWYKGNAMDLFNARDNSIVTDDIANAIALRPDIHRSFKEREFVFVPKADHWVTHFLQPTCEFGRMFHNVPTDIAESVKPELLLARFAWAIFPLVKFFIVRGPMRSVRVREESSDKEPYLVNRTWGPDDFRRLSSKSRGRSSSPEKRKASEELSPISKTKHHCVGDRLRAAPNSENMPNSHIRDLAGDSSCGAASDFLPPIRKISSEDERLSALRRRELRKRRPSNPDLMCCDYNFAEYASSHGIPGKPEQGGAYLCLQCLGAEIDPLQDLPDEPNVVSGQGEDA